MVIVIAAVVEDAAQDHLVNLLVKHADDVLGVVVAVLIGDNIGGLHVPGVQLGSPQRHLGFWLFF